MFEYFVHETRNVQMRLRPLVPLDRVEGGGFDICWLGYTMGLDVVEN